MLQAIVGYISPNGTPEKGKPFSPPTANINLSPRNGRKPIRHGSEPDMKEKLIQQLQNELMLKDSMLSALNNKISKLESSVESTNGEINEGVTVRRRKHPLVGVTHVVQSEGKISKSKMGTRGSILTTNILEAIDDCEKPEIHGIAEKFIQVFQSPVEHLEYMQSAAFGQELMQLCEAVEEIFENESRCLMLQSPVYVIGDIHGNLEDLHFFSDNIWKLGMDLTAGKFLFLGDYVDRGMSSLECLAYLFAMKVLHPKKIYMLRGNHETRDVNGWEEHYHAQSFLYQCKDRFGKDLGEQVWEECNQAFDRLPFSGIIDREIYCCHGGIPRPVSGFDSEIQAIMELPTVAAVMPSYDHEEEWMKQVCADCIWSDPASEAMEPRLRADGFGDSPRGGGAVCFGSVAIDNFLQANGLSYIIRAHEAHAQGVSLSKGARVFTVFSTSKDHRQGCRAMAGCILVDEYTIKVITRSPKYRNKYVHRRTSVSLHSLTEEEVNNRCRLGLIRTSVATEDYYRLKREMAEEDAENSSPSKSNVSRVANNVPKFL